MVHVYLIGIIPKMLLGDDGMKCTPTHSYTNSAVADPGGRGRGGGCPPPILQFLPHHFYPWHLYVGHPIPPYESPGSNLDNGTASVAIDSEKYIQKDYVT